MPTSSVPSIRRRFANEADPRPDGRYVLYWMTGHRRTRFNFALQHAVDEANRLDRPLVVLEALRCGYRWANRRHHAFILRGMADTQRAAQGSGTAWLTYVEDEAGHGTGLLERLAGEACLVVGDDAPVFFLPRMMRAAADRLDVRFELVDSNGLLPLRAADKVFARAYDFRRFLQRELAPHLLEMPVAEPLESLRISADRDELLASTLTAQPYRSGFLEADALESSLEDLLDRLPIDQGVRGGVWNGGQKEAGEMLERFVEERLDRYDDGRRDLDHRSTTELSPHLHYGQISTHEILAAVAEHEDWTPMDVSDSKSGKRTGWWGMSEAAESFLDELVTWREVGYNMAWQEEETYETYESLPDWAKRTLEDHAGDEREHVYDLEQFETADTHDEIWNAAQRELVRDGRIHNYLRMLWGKKILEWTEHPRDALDIMIELNNKYALDGRDPNSISGIFWCLGRYDRAWGPERPIFGKVRFMSSDSTRRKLKLANYLDTYGPGGEGNQVELFELKTD